MTLIIHEIDFSFLRNKTRMICDYAIANTEELQRLQEY